MKKNIQGDFQICISVPLSRSATRSTTRMYHFISNNDASFNLW